MASKLIQTQMYMSKTQDKSRRGRSSQSRRRPSPQSTSVLSSIRVDKPIIPNPETIEIIKRVFSGKDINIENKTDIHISEKGEDCALFIIYPDHIYIEALHKCGTTKGNDLLEKFDILASEIPNMSYIRLSDDSNIELCGHKIKLYILKILTTGESWYNKHGYVSDETIGEKAINARNINMQYEKFRDMVYKDQIHLEKIKAELDTGIRLFPKTEKTVKDYFKYVLNDINKNIEEKGCDDEETKAKCRWLSNFISHITISFHLRYKQIDLFKESLAGGPKIKRSKSKKSKSKKSKSKKSKSKRSKKSKRKKK